MSMALVMSTMPDVWQKVLAEHVPDHTGRCGACRNTAGETASWPCQTYKVAQEAKWVAEGNLPGTGPHGSDATASPRIHRPEPAPGGGPAGAHATGGFPATMAAAAPSADPPPSGRRSRHAGSDALDGPSWSPSQPPGGPTWPDGARGDYGGGTDTSYGSSFGVDDRHRGPWS